MQVTVAYPLPYKSIIVLIIQHLKTSEHWLNFIYCYLILTTFSHIKYISQRANVRYSKFSLLTIHLRQNTFVKELTSPLNDVCRKIFSYYTDNIDLTNLVVSYSLTARGQASMLKT